MSEKNIYQRINAVMKVVKYVQKDITVTGAGSYKAVSHDMVLAVLREQLVTQGIVVRLEQLKGSIVQMRDLKADIKMHLYSGDYTVHFVNMDKPDDCVSVTINAHAADSGDKSPGKATSMAVKYAMLKTFGLETGENEESRFSEPYTPEQAEVYHDLIDKNKAYEFYLFISVLPHETQIGLVNSFPEGKKMQGKKAVKEMSEQGRAEFLEAVETVRGRIDQQDIAVLEITNEMTTLEKKLLMSHLTDFEITQLKRLKEASEK